MPEEPTRTPEEEGERIAHLMLFILAGAKAIQGLMLDRVEVDRDAVVEAASAIEKHVMELAHHVLGADISEWQAKQEREREAESE